MDFFELDNSRDLHLISFLRSLLKELLGFQLQNSNAITTENIYQMSHAFMYFHICGKEKKKEQGLHGQATRTCDPWIRIELVKGINEIFFFLA